MSAKLKNNRVSALLISFSFLIIILLVLAAADKTITIEGDGNTTFAIENFAVKDITSSSFSAEPYDSEANVTFNGNALGKAKDLTSIPLDYFNDSNEINFSEEIDSFELTYNYYRTDGLCPEGKDECPPGYNSCRETRDYGRKCFSSATGCTRSGECASGDVCVFGSCCLESNIMSFGILGSESCLGSSVGVHPEPLCPSADDSRIPINFYLEKSGVKIGLRQGLPDCSVNGDPGWDLLGIGPRCEASIPTGIATGTYSLKANYTINSEVYVYTINNNFNVEATCGTDVQCGHSTGLTGAVAPVRFSATESVPGSSASEYYIPKGARVNITGIGAYNAQCSNGVTWLDRPGVVTWTVDKGTQIATGDNGLFNQGACKIPANKPRDDLIGRSARPEGYLPPNCDMHMGAKLMGNKDTASVYNFPDGGEYTVYVDYINAHCDSPDYICPYIQPGQITSPPAPGLCWIGTMKERDRATGWNYLSYYSVIVVDPQINAEELSKTSGGDFVTFIFNITNTGLGGVNVTSFSLSSSDFSSSYHPPRGFPINEAGSQKLVVSMAPKVASKQIVNSVVPYEYDNITLNNYSSYSFNENKLTVNYAIPLDINYDDNYGFSLQPVQTKIQTLDFSFDFECRDRLQVINLKDRVFYCTCKGKRFCIRNKTGINAPCACIDEPQKNTAIIGTNVKFNATRSFDDATQPEALSFGWYYDLQNEKFYNETGMAGAFFTTQFPAPEEYNIRLEVKDLDNLIGIDRTRFILTFGTGPNCMEIDGEYYWVSSDGTNALSKDDCYKEGGWPSTTCCPRTNSCILNRTDPNYYKCLGPPSPNLCPDYQTREECEGFNKDVAKRSADEMTGIANYCGSAQSDVIGGKTCWWWIIDCRCVWNETKDTCESRYSATNLTCPGEPVNVVGNCTFITLERKDECNITGFIKYLWGGYWDGPEEEKPDTCKDGNRSFKCAAKLMFFTIASLIIAIVAIIIIYLLILKNRKRKRRKEVHKKKKK